MSSFILVGFGFVLLIVFGICFLDLF
jgi:hypothetical protein